jgi:hypothetical protein
LAASSIAAERPERIPYFEDNKRLATRNREADLARSGCPLRIAQKHQKNRHTRGNISVMPANSSPDLRVKSSAQIASIIPTLNA